MWGGKPRLSLVYEALEQEQKVKANTIHEEL
jgi:hypothetical protein